MEVREILNYVVAAEEAFAWIEERELTGSVIRGLQLTLVQQTPGEYSDAGTCATAKSSSVRGTLQSRRLASFPHPSVTN